MTRASGRSALMVAVGVLVGAALAAPAAADDLNTPVFVSPGETTTQPTAAAQPAGQNQAAAPNQLNDSNRASSESAPAQPSAPAATSETPAASAPTSNATAAPPADSQHSVWDDTSLIGKIFIGFGALLTVASAARMFMA